jgi:hypothetical protein
MGPWTVFLDREYCPKKNCPWCKNAPLTYPFHLHCLGTLHQLFQNQKILEMSDWRLRCAEALSSRPVVLDQQSPSPRLLVKAFYAHYDELTSLLAHGTPLQTLLERLSALPFELQELVFFFSLEHPGGDFLFDKATITALQALHAWPEKRHRQLSCKGSLFARWITSGSRSCLAGLYDEPVPGSFQVKSMDEQWNRAVITWSDSRVIGIVLIGSDPALATADGPDSVQIVHRPTHGNLWITAQVVRYSPGSMMES